MNDCIMNECKMCKKLKDKVEKLRIELTETRDKYSVICDRLWNIVYKV